VSESYAETAVLIAIMNGDLDEADRLLSDFHPIELRTFEDQTSLLDQAIRKARRALRDQR
jgi:hypothetical protein